MITQELYQTYEVLYNPKFFKFYFKVAYEIGSSKQIISADVVSLEQVKIMLTHYINYKGSENILSLKLQSTDHERRYNTIKLINHKLFEISYNVCDELNTVYRLIDWFYKHIPPNQDIDRTFQIVKSLDKLDPYYFDIISPLILSINSENSE